MWCEAVDRLLHEKPEDVSSISKLTPPRWWRPGIPVLLSPDAIMSPARAVDTVAATAEEKAKNFMKKGETILLSTHSLNLAKDMCSRGLVMEKGRLIFDGSVEEAIDTYLGR